VITAEFLHEEPGLGGSIDPADIRCPTSGVAQGSLIESGVLLTRRPQEKTSV
jgi:hypothetical protein